MDKPEKIKYLILVILLLVLGVFSWWIILFISRIGEVKTLINIAPSTATLKIDGQTVDKNLFYLSKGSHEIEASLEGFESIKKTVEVNSETDEITLLLNPNSETGREYLIKNPDQQQEREAMGSKEFQDTNDKLQQKYPYLNQLPLYNRHFKISYGKAVKTPSSAEVPSIALYIVALRPQDRQLALSYLYKELGVEANSVEIIFEGFFNPFQAEEAPHGE